MIIDLPHEKIVEPKKLYQELITQLGYEVDFRLLDTQRTETSKDDLGREEVRYLGFSFNIEGVKIEDITKIDAVIEAHVPTEIIPIPSLEDRISALERIIVEQRQ